MTNEQAQQLEAMGVLRKTDWIASEGDYFVGGTRLETWYNSENVITASRLTNPTSGVYHPKAKVDFEIVQDPDFPFQESGIYPFNRSAYAAALKELSNDNPTPSDSNSLQ